MPWTTACQTSLSFTISRSLLRFMNVELVMPSNHLILSHPSPSIPNLSQHQVFSSESALQIRWSKYWSFTFSITPSSEYSGLISFRIYWLDLLVVQGTLKSLLLQHSLKTSILQFLTFFMIQLSYPYMTTGKTIALTIQTFVGKVMSLFFFLYMMSRFVIAFLPRSKCLLNLWLQSLSTVILEPKKMKSACFHCFPIYLPWSDETRGHDLSFLNVEL